MIIGVVIMLIQKKLPKYVGAPPSEIQVMTPTRKGLLGVERLNSILQRYLNPPDPGKEEKEINGRIFRKGDKVMQIKNNYQIAWEVRTKYGVAVDQGMGVFNGDMGCITEVAQAHEAEGGLRRDGGADAHDGHKHNGGEEVGRQMPPQHMEEPRPHAPCRQHVLALPQPPHLGADHLRHASPPRDADDHREADHAGLPQDRLEQDDEQ